MKILEKNSHDINLLLRVFSIFIEEKGKAVTICLCLAAYFLISFTFPILNKYIIDDGVLAKDFGNVLLLSGMFISLSIILSAVSIVKEKVRITVSNRAYQKLLSDAFNSLLDVRISYFTEKNSAEIFNDLEVDSSNILVLFSDSIFFAISQVLIFLGGLVGLFVLDSRLALLIVLIIPLKFCTVKLLGKKKKKAISNFISSKNALAHWFGDSLQGMKEARALGFEDRFKNDLLKNIHPVTKNIKRLTILDAYNENVEHVLFRAIEGLLFIIGALFIFDQSLTLGGLFAVIAYAMYVVDPISSILNIHYSLSSVLPSVRRYYQFLDDAGQNKETSGEAETGSFTQLRFSDVSFSHTDTPILSKANFTINAGDHIAIVGKNGTGKSTIFNLLQKFYEPDSGSILLNGVNIQEYQKEAYRKHFASINQDSYLFDIGLVENIKLFEEIASEEFKNVLQQTKVSDFFAEKEQSGIGQNGRGLSGGQRQKVLLARMLLQKREIYLLDEATANLDASSEEAIMSLLTTALSEKTTIIITHRPEVIKSMNKVLFLSGDGNVDVYDSYDTMLQKQLLAVNS